MIFIKVDFLRTRNNLSKSQEKSIKKGILDIGKRECIFSRSNTEKNKELF